jgi:WD repeat-containing protein 60
MSESEEERRLRKEKKREAARRAAEKEARQHTSETPADAKSASDTHPAKETEEDRRLRKEKKRAQREAAKKREEEEARAAGDGESSAGLHRHHHHRHSRSEEENKTDAASPPPPPSASARNEGAVEPKRMPKATDDNAALLRAIEAENKAVVQTSARSSTVAATHGVTTAKADEEPRKETEEERAARKQAEREERRRQRHAAKAAAAAAASTGGGAESDSPPTTDGGSAGKEKKSATPSPAGPSPTTDFDPNELQRQAYRAQFQKDLARATALRRLVDFDSSGGVVLDLAPQTAYDLYIRDFGQSGREQAKVQAPPEEERLDAATQAERGKLRTRGAQAPDDLGLCPEEEAERQFFQLRRSALQRSGKADGSSGPAGESGDNDANDETTSAGGGGGAEAGGVKPNARRAARSVDATLLERFLTSTLPLMSAVLDENNAAASGAAAAAVAAATSNSDGKSKGSTAFSSSYTTFCWRGTRNRPLVQVLLNPSNTRQLIALHGPRDESGPSPVLDTYMSVLLLWNVHDTTTPERVLVAFSTVTSVCVSPTRPYLIYGGTEDGNVCVWSLREPDRMHLAAGRYEKVVFHLPSYSTSWQADGHAAPVRQVRVCGYNAKTPSRKEEHEQLASMDERGVVCFWAVSDKESAGRGGGGAPVIDNDYGQHPFTSVSLHLAKGTFAAAAAAGGLDMAAGDSAADATTVAYGASVTAAFDFSPLDAAQYVLTAPHGVVRRSRFGGIAVPSFYSPAQATFYYLAGERTTSAKGGATNMTGEAAQGAVVAVPCCVQYSVLDPRWFVAGYEDGTLRLFLHNEATPQLTVEVGYQPIVSVRCSGTTPWVVWALDESGEVHMVDFAHHSRQTPRLSHALTQPDTGVCTCIDISAKDEKADQRVLVAGFEKGMVQLHILDTEKLRIANAERDEKWI